jgi:hypothetical protein
MSLAAEPIAPVFFALDTLGTQEKIRRQFSSQPHFAIRQYDSFGGASL